MSIILTWQFFSLGAGAGGGAGVGMDRFGISHQGWVRQKNFIFRERGWGLDFVGAALCCRGM